MSDHRHAATYRDAMDMFNEGDPSGLADLIADDVEWWMLGVDEPVQGKAALEQTMAEGMPGWNIHAELHDVLSNDEHLIALVNATATHADGRSLTYRTAEIHHVDADGKITQRWAFSDDTKAIIDFFAES